MKAIALAVALTATTVQASEFTVCTQQNKAGGSINLTLEPSQNAKGKRFGYMTTSTGYYMTFDYQLIDNNILAIYEDGQKMMYPINTFDCSVLQKMTGSKS